MERGEVRHSIPVGGGLLVQCDNGALGNDGCLSGCTSHL